MGKSCTPRQETMPSSYRESTNWNGLMKDSGERTLGVRLGGAGKGGWVQRT